MQLKVLVVGGFIDSKFDREEHYIKAIELCRLYRVNPNVCRLIDTNGSRSIKLRGIYVEDYDIVLKPLYDGNYEEHAKKLAVFLSGNVTCKR